MAAKYKIPGVYVEEIAKLPPSIAQAETAIPAFIGYTEKATKKKERDLNLKPTKISSLLDYENYFGKAKKETKIHVLIIDTALTVKEPDEDEKSPFLMYYALEMYFANGGGPCYILPVGQYGTLANPTFKSLDKGLKKIAKVDEPTLLVFPDATSLVREDDFYQLYNNALLQCHDLKDRFTIIDTFKDSQYAGKDPIDSLRLKINLDVDYLKYGAAYFPFLITTLEYIYDENAIDVVTSNAGTNLSETVKLSTLKIENPVLYNKIKTKIKLLPVKLSPSSAVAGIYAQQDAKRGVWKAPANIAIKSCLKPSVEITNKDEDRFNIDVVAGKSINTIRNFTGKGTLVWGARTLAGNDNEWRYVPVRRFFNMVEESVKKATEQFVFEPNDANTWIRVINMIENFLILQWRAGALAGSKPEDAFFVRTGLGATMTAQDILDGILIIEIGMAVVRPAEFIILRFSHKMQSS